VFSVCAREKAMFRVLQKATPSQLKRVALLRAASLGSHAPAAHHEEVDSLGRNPDHYAYVGERERVGVGSNLYYQDMESRPMPTIRWRPETKEIQALRAKSFSQLTVDEKKKLYRHDFRLSFAEMGQQDAGEWKFEVGVLLALLGVSYLFITAVRRIVIWYPTIDTTTDEYKTRMLERWIAEGVGKVEGIASHWDYETGDWKKNK